MPTLSDIYSLSGVYIYKVDGHFVDSVVEVDPEEILTDRELTSDTYLRVDFVDEGIESVFFDFNAEVTANHHGLGNFDALDTNGRTQCLEVGRFTPINPSELA